MRYMRMGLKKISEDQTRKQLIDPQLERAGWYLRARQAEAEELFQSLLSESFG